MSAPTEGPVVNEGLLLKVLDKIRFDPESWRQGIWIGEAACGTVGCFAGWAVMLSGYQAAWIQGNSTPHYDGGIIVRRTSRAQVSGGSVTADVPVLAERLLGLTRLERSQLFAGMNSFEDLERITKDIISGESRKEDWDPRD